MGNAGWFVATFLPRVEVSSANDLLAVGDNDDVDATSGIVDSFGHHVLAVDADLRLVVFVFARVDVHGELVLLARIGQTAVPYRCASGDASAFVHVGHGEGKRYDGTH